MATRAWLSLHRLYIGHQVVRTYTTEYIGVCVWHSGVTDSYVSGFWWLQLLGSLGPSRHDFACRQALVGGRYALVDLRRRQRWLD